MLKTSGNVEAKFRFTGLISLQGAAQSAVIDSYNVLIIYALYLILHMLWLVTHRYKIQNTGTILC